MENNKYENFIEPKIISKESFSLFGDVLTTKGYDSIEINDGYAKRFDDISKLDTSKNDGQTKISIFSAVKRTFPMKINMMEQHPLGSQAFIPMKETTFLTFVAPKAEKPDLKKLKLLLFLLALGLTIILNLALSLNIDRKYEFHCDRQKRQG